MPNVKNICLSCIERVECLFYSFYGIDLFKSPESFFDSLTINEQEDLFEEVKNCTENKCGGKK